MSHSVHVKIVQTSEASVDMDVEEEHSSHMASSFKRQPEYSSVGSVDDNGGSDYDDALYIQDFPRDKMPRGDEDYHLTHQQSFELAECKDTWRKQARSIPFAEHPRLASTAADKIKANLGDGNIDASSFNLVPDMKDFDLAGCTTAAFRYVPSLTWLPQLFKREDRCTVFQADALAGICVGIMAIPQSMSYASIAGLPYIYGLYAMLISTAIYAFFGTSKQMAIGPTAIMSIIVYDGLANVLNEDNCPAMATSSDKPNELCPEAYVSAALVLSFWVGLINLLAGLVNMGTLVNFLAHPVIAGFTSGAGIIIGLSQMKYIVGTNVKKSKIIYETLYNIFSVFDDWNWVVIAFGCVWILMLAFFKWLSRNYDSMKLVKPAGPLIVSVIGIIICFAFPSLKEKHGVDLVGDIPSGFPDFTLTDLDFSYTGSVMGGAISASVIGFLESIAIAKSIAAQHPGDEVNADNEMVALGVTNFVGSFFSCYPVTGSFSRSAVNNSSGALSQMAGLWTCFIIAATLLVLTPVIYYLPKFALAAIVINSVRGLVSFEEFFHLWKIKKNDAVIWALAFLGTLFLGITYGIGLAVLISIALVLRRTMRAQLSVLWRLPKTHVFADIKITQTGIFTPGVLVIRVGNMMYFANCAAIKEEIKELIKKYSEYDPVKFVVISLSPVYSVDASAIHLLEEIVKDILSHEMEVEFACVNSRVMEGFERSHIMEVVDVTHDFHETEYDAVQDCVAQLTNMKLAQERSKSRRASITAADFLDACHGEMMFEPFHSHY